MQIELSQETLKLLEAAMANGRFASVDECIAAMVKQTHNGHSTASLVDKLAEAQGVGTIKDYRALRADFWPEDESPEDFVREIRERRNSDEPRAR